LELDKHYISGNIERRQVHGLTLEQEYNSDGINNSIFLNIVTKNKEIPKHIKEDLFIAAITTKYTQSNSVAIAYKGQAIGIGAGQQSRIHCIRLACAKAEKWFLRHHPKLLDLFLDKSVKLYDKANVIDCLLEENKTDYEKLVLLQEYGIEPNLITKEEKLSWIQKMSNVSLSSDGYFPFIDSIERAASSGVKYIIEPGGSIRDQHVIQTANRYNMVMAFSNLRLFHH
jgi:phosphoribosylaminoimidazolecarboxamide formyltransferase/IMP cyclohydrolase